MRRFVFPAVLGLCGVTGLVVYLNRPEPTPTERLGDAMENAGDALRDAGAAISDGVQDIQEEVASNLTSASAELSEMVANSTEKMSAEAATLVKAWQEAEIFTEEGFNFDNAIKAVEDSSLEGQKKDRIATLLHDIRDAPEKAAEKLREIHTELAAGS